MTKETHYSSKYDMLVNLTEGKFDAFLYDCDGTLADNMHLHKDAYVKIASRHGLELDPAIIDEFAGLPTVKVVEEINKRYKTNFDTREFADAKSGVFYEEFIEHTRPVDFVVEHLLSHAGKIKIAVVSGGRRKTVTRTLETLGLLDKIDVLVCAGETPNGKPSPEPFLKAAKELGVAPHRCMVFEDGDPGVRGAQAAGMEWVRVDWL